MMRMIILFSACVCVVFVKQVETQSFGTQIKFSSKPDTHLHSARKSYRPKQACLCLMGFVLFEMKINLWFVNFTVWKLFNAHQIYVMKTPFHQYSRLHTRIIQNLDFFASSTCLYHVSIFIVHHRLLCSLNNIFEVWHFLEGKSTPAAGSRRGTFWVFLGISMKKAARQANEFVWMPDW